MSDHYAIAPSEQFITQFAKHVMTHIRNAEREFETLTMRRRAGGITCRE